MLEERKRKEEEEIRKAQEELKRAEEEKRRKEEERRRINKLRMEEERKRKEEEEKQRKHEELQRAEKEKQQREAERKRKEEERIRIETMKREEEEERRKLAELQRVEEERQRKEDERQRQEKDRIKKENEESKRKEEEERKRLEELRRAEEEERRREEEMRMKEEEERRKKEEERKREEEATRRQQEELERAEEENCRREEERKRKDEERRRIEEEIRQEREKRKQEEDERIRKLDPNYWTPISYMQNDGEVDGAHGRLVCIVSAIQGQLSEDDLECLASDEYIDGDESLNLGDRPASSMVHISSRTGRKNLEAPMRVFVPYNQVDRNEEIAIKCSTDGHDWIEKEQIYQPEITNDFKELSLVAAEINNYEETKMRVVARTKSEDITVEKQRLTHQSSIDKKVKFVFPRDTFKDRTNVKLQICQIQPERLKLAIQQHENYENILSTSPLITINCAEATDVDIDVDISRQQRLETQSEKGCYHHVYRGKDRQWHFADSGIKNRSQDVTITLPRGKRYYSVLEIETRKDVSRDIVLQAAEDIFNLVTRSVVRLIARQKADNPSTLHIQCVRRDQIAARLAELDTCGYNSGPDASREICLWDVQEVFLKCKGNIGMNTIANQNDIEHSDLINSATFMSGVRLVYRDYMDSAKQEVSLFVVDENKQRDNDSYLGLLLFETTDRDGKKMTGDMPISLPKHQTYQQKPRTARATVRFQPYLLFSEEALSWLSSSTKDDLQSLVAKLQLPSEVTKQCINEERDRQMYHVWSKWQLSNAVISKGPEASDYCLETMLSLTGNERLIQDLKLKLQQT